MVELQALGAVQCHENDIVRGAVNGIDVRHERDLREEAGQRRLVRLLFVLCDLIFQFQNVVDAVIRLLGLLGAKLVVIAGSL